MRGTRSVPFIVGLLLVGALTAPSHAAVYGTTQHGVRSGSPKFLENIGGTVLFRGSSGAYPKELWKSDGTAAGTVLLKNINTGGPGFWGWSRPFDLTNVRGTVFFSASADNQHFSLWKSDGTADGTVWVKYLYPSSQGGADARPTSFTDVGGTVFFAGMASGRYELWKSNGTTDGTVLVKGDIHSVYWLTNVGGTLFFASDGGLWKSDGTTDGTVLLNNGASGLTNVGGALFFGRSDGLWKSDGTTDGTVLVKDINPTGSSILSREGTLAAVSGELFFAARDGVHGFELWKSDGTAQGTVLLKDINESGPSYPQLLTTVGDTLFFAARDGVHGFELWESDGTRRGTRLVKDVRPGAGDSLPWVARLGSGGSAHSCGGPFPYFNIGPSVCTELVGVGDRLYFGADDGRHGRELWKSDGTRAGTVMVKNINPSGSSSPRWLTNAQGRLFFSAYDPVHGRELWKSDGTSERTTLVRDIWR